MANRDYQADRIQILKDMLAAIELCDDDTYADGYDRLIALEKEAGEYDGLDCDCELEICPACGGIEGTACNTCNGDLVIDKSVIRPDTCWACGTPYDQPGGCEFCPGKAEVTGDRAAIVSPLLQPGERIVAYHTGNGCGGPMADRVTCTHCQGGVLRCLKCGTVWSSQRPSVSLKEVRS